MKRALLSVVLAVTCLITLTGCTTYYRVTDPVSGRMYYTTDLDNQGGGAVRFKDARSGSEVTLQNSSVQKVTKEEFESSRGMSGNKL